MKSLFDLSVVIVNYNVQYFLEQCILSIQAASNNLKVEVIVVDNLSEGKMKNLNPKAKFYLADIRSELINEIFLSAGEKEFPFIEKSGFYFDWSLSSYMIQ